MKMPPIVGVACLARCNCATSADALLIGSRKRAASQAIQRGPQTIATTKLAIAASAVRSVVLSQPSKGPGAAPRGGQAMHENEQHA